jgi:arsenate reductase (glutaredoxin)
MKIYHNPRCKKSRGGLQYLQDKGIDAEIVDYIKNPISVDELTEILKKLGKSPEEMIRKQEDLFKKEYKSKSLSDNEWIKVIAENPKLLQRPIVVKGDKAVWAQPPEEIDKLL